MRTNYDDAAARGRARKARSPRRRSDELKHNIRSTPAGDFAYRLRNRRLPVIDYLVRADLILETPCLRVVTGRRDHASTQQLRELHCRDSDPAGRPYYEHRLAGFDL